MIQKIKIQIVLFRKKTILIRFASEEIFQSVKIANSGRIGNQKTLMESNELIVKAIGGIKLWQSTTFHTTTILDFASSRKPAEQAELYLPGVSRTVTKTA